MQKSGIVDTMWDLIVDAVGALFVSFIGYIYLKTGKFGFIEKMSREFVRNIKKST